MRRHLVLLLMVGAWALAFCSMKPMPLTAGFQDASGSTNQAQSESDPPVGPVGEDDSATDGNDSADASSGSSTEYDYYPLIVLAVGVSIVLGLIIGFKVNAFLALITAAMVVSLMAGGPIESKISRVASAFGGSAGGIGIVIAFAAVIGKCMLDSGAADRIVRFFTNSFGEKRSGAALMGSGFVLAVPVFFDTVFYLLVPLARSLHRKTKRDYLKYVLAIGAGGAITHTLVPPTPGPLLVAGNLGVDVGMMILVGSLVALPAAIAGLLFGGLAQKIMKTPMRTQPGETEPDPLPDDKLPPLWLALAPVLLPVLLISTKTVTTTMADAERAAQISVDDIVDWPAFRSVLEDAEASEELSPSLLLIDHPEMQGEPRELLLSGATLSDDDKATIVDALNLVLVDKKFYQEEAFLGIAINDTAEGLLSSNLVRMKPVDAERMNRALLESTYDESILKRHEWDTPKRKLANLCNLLGDANLALLLSTIIALATLVRQRGSSLRELSRVVEVALMSGGVIILITAGGGAFGDMLKTAEVGPAIQELFSGTESGSQTGLGLLFLGFLLAAVLKVAQGSSTVAMIVGSGMMAAIVGDQSLGYHPVYLATSIGAGSLVGSWMNDSGFWIFAKMGGLTEAEALKSWTVMLVLLGLVSFGMSVLLSMVMPLV